MNTLKTDKEIHAEYLNKFNYSSFTWNGDNATGVKFAKKKQKEVADFWLSKRTQDRTNLLEGLRNRIENLLARKYEGIERIDAKLESMIMYCLSDEYDDSPKSSHLGGDNEIQK